MTRRLYLATFLLIFCVSTVWPKWKEEDQQYLDMNFRMLQEQIQSVRSQVDTMTANLAELRQNQAQLQAVIIRQQRALQDMEQIISSIRLGNEENFSTLKTTLSQLRTEQQKAFSTLTGQAAPTPGGGVETAAAPPRPAAPLAQQALQGYITVVEGNNVTVDLGSTQGLRAGSRLAIYKSTDPGTRVGVLEVTQVDAGNSRARIVTMTAGVKPDFSDIVRLE